MDNNNLYQVLIPIKDHQIVSKEKPAPSPNVMNAVDIFLLHGYDDMGQHIIPINKSGLQDIFALWRK